MTNEQTIDAIMKSASHYVNSELAYHSVRSAVRAGKADRRRDALRHAITAGLAAKDAEIERLNHAYHQQRENAQSRVDAAVLRALSAERTATEIVAEIAELKQRLADSMRDLQALKADPAPGEWVEWKGGECPIADGVKFQFKFRDGSQDKGCEWTNARDWIWADCGYTGDIVAYRIIP